MIEPKVAAAQIQRLSGLNFFPKEAAAQKELRLALEPALSEAIAASVVDDWLSTATECPKPAELRRLTYDKQQDIVEQRRNCTICEGTGFVTNWYIVTYQGKSFVIKKSEKIPGSYEEAMRLARVLAEPLVGSDRQQVISGAKDCTCRKAA